jgi:hypothetical protein
MGTSYGEEIVFSTLGVSMYDGAVDLSSKESANCYIVPTTAGEYFIDLVKGNSSESVGEAVSADILWETYNTDEEVVDGTVVESASIYTDRVVFTIPSNAHPGNAIIAVKDAFNTILWSWHIWVTDYDPILDGQIYPSGAILMDRHLGALSAEMNDPKTNGLLYQWGRKDPFVGFVDSNEDLLASTYPIDAMSFNDSGSVDYQYSIEHPTESIRGSSEWCVGPKWDVRKTIYDPCPAGWRVPEGDPGVWSGVTENVTVHYHVGMTFNSVTPEAYYPTSGYLNAEGKGDSETWYGWVWSCSLNANDASNHSDPYALVYSSFGNGSSHLGERRSRGHHFNVRCMKVNNHEESGNGNDYIVDDEYEW